MNWENIAGQKNLKKLLQESIAGNRVSHAQLFVGKEGYGSMPLVLAYAKEILKGESEQAASKVDHLNHLDLHFCFPVFTEKNNSLSKKNFEEFRSMILQSPYASFDDWSGVLESENKQLFISADEMDDQNQKFALKSFEGGTKILIVWRADKMNAHAANKFLKFLEEPPAKTLIMLTAESVDDILPTILSRTQIISVPRIDDEELRLYLKDEHQVSDEKIAELVHQAQGDLNEVLKLLHSQNKNSDFESLFVQWVRDAFMVKKKPEYLRSIISWAREVASWNREKQKNFLNYCSEIFRLAMFQNYGQEELVYKKIDSGGFNWGGFSKYISGANIISILEEINEADHHLTRNGNPKIVWTDLGIKLSRYIHKS